jgi:alkaline phosphatase
MVSIIIFRVYYLPLVNITVDVDKDPCGTVLESAKIHKNMLTGLVATSRITHATPASFSAHVVDRDMEDQIATQQIGDNPLGRTVDLLFGGGLCHFLSNTTQGSCRSDQRDVWTEATDKHGWKKAIQTRHDFDDLSPSDSLPVIGLFTPDVCLNIFQFNDLAPSYSIY